VRRLLLFVAIVALLCWGVLTLDRRSARYRLKAAKHEKALLECAMLGRGEIGYESTNLKTRENNTYYMYHVEMNKKYDQAARFPWLSVAPDPPEPER
jgi:hypothetical protein